MRKLDFTKLKNEITKLKNKAKNSKKEKKEKVQSTDNTEIKASKSKVDKKAIFTVIIITLVGLALIVGIAGLIYLKFTIDDAPTFDVNDLTNVESSKIYDSNGEIIGDVGLVNRENVSYDELPQSFIDAIVATEDSRFFVHNGFDLPRFIKSLWENIKTFSFSQGASTLSMQFMKNVYFTDDGQKGYAKSIAYKIQQIYLAIRSEKDVSKKSMFEYYVNRINFGASSTRGIKGAAEYYFGKSVNELTLSESAYLAGVINAPGSYNAYKHYDKALARRNMVLYLMNLHGYISDEEYKLAKSIDLADQLVGTGTGESKQYQAYINEVVSEVIELTGKDPYSTTMNIYTYMNKELQDEIEAIEAGKIDYVKWSDDIVQCGIISMDNQTGAIVGIGGGRDTIVAKGFSRVSDMKRQPGSSVKPFLDYALAFEYLGYSTKHMIEDVPTVYRGTGIRLNNFDGTFSGEVLLDYAVGKSLNIPAYKTLEKVLDSIGETSICEYLNSLGFTQVDEDSFDLGYSIGGSTFEVTVKQMAAAHSAMINGGYSITPHTVARIEFNDGSEPYVPDYPKVKVISEESAYLATYLMEQDVTGPYSNYMQLLKRDYEVYAKTGTTNYDDSFVDIGIPKGVAKDKWMIASTSEYTTAVWIGYDSAVEGAYFTSAKSALNMPGRINSRILDVLHKDNKPKDVVRPDNVVDITHIAGLYPYTAPVDGMNPEAVVTGLINKKYYNLKTLEAPSIENLKDFEVKDIEIKDGKIYGKLVWSEYPDESALSDSATYTYTLEYTDTNGNAQTISMDVTRLFNVADVYGAVEYVASWDKGTLAKSHDNEESFSIDIPTDATSIDIVGYYKFDNGPSSNKISQSISLAIPKAEFAALTTIEKVNTFRNKYGLNWEMKPVQMTDDTQTEGSIISIGNTTYPDLTTITEDIALSKLNGVIVKYYNNATETINENLTNLSDLKTKYPELSGITISYVNTLIEDDDGKVKTSAGISSGEVKILDLIKLGSVTVEIWDYDGCKVSASSKDETKGTVSVDHNLVHAGETATFTASPATGYKFVSWSDGSTEQTHSLVINSDTNLVATFEATE